MTPVLFNASLVLGDSCGAAIGCPVRGGLVVEGHIDVRVVLDLLKLVRRLVCNEDEGHLGL